MITASAIVTDTVSGQVVQTIAYTFIGFEFALGAILGSIAALIVWINFKSLGA